MDVVAALIKLKPNSQDRVREWAETINHRKVEALATLSDEGVVMESWFQVKVEGQDYLLCCMRSESIERARQAGRRPDCGGKVEKAYSLGISKQ